MCMDVEIPWQLQVKCMSSHKAILEASLSYLSNPDEYKKYDLFNVIYILYKQGGDVCKLRLKMEGEGVWKISAFKYFPSK